MATYGTIPHRITPGVVVSICALPENLQWSSADAYGFASASWDQRTAPSCAEGDEVTVTSEGETVFEGTVRSVTDSGAVAERLLYHVDCVGVCESLKANETIEGVFVDRDVSQWQTYSYGWQAVPDFEIRCDVSDELRFSWPTQDVSAEGSDRVLVWQDDVAKDTWPLYAGNIVPPHSDGDFFPPPVMWTACVYQLGNGATSKSITRFKMKVEYDLTNYAVAAGMTTSDYEHPLGPYDAKYGYRQSEYPLIGLWDDYYAVQAPRTSYLGVYACDSVDDLPTNDPQAMRHDSHALAILANLKWESGDLVFDGLDAQCIVMYAAYRPVYHPTWEQIAYDEEYEHLIRVGWAAKTRLLCQTGQYVNVSGLEVCAQGYTPQPDGSDDLRKVLNILYGNIADCPSLKLPTDASKTPRSIALRTPTTIPSAVADLLALTEQQYSWGFYEGGALSIWEPSGAPGLAIADEPGVDTTGCGVSDEGAVDRVLVAYTPPPRAWLLSRLSTPRVGFLVVDKSGSYEVVTAGWTPGADEAVAYLDARQSAQSEVAAAQMGQSVAIERRRGQASGSVNLHAIASASTTRPGGILTGPGVPDEARITQVSVTVDSDSVSLSLGPVGYHGRFPMAQPGVPATATPTGSGMNITSRIPERPVGPKHS